MSARETDRGMKPQPPVVADFAGSIALLYKINPESCAYTIARTCGRTAETALKHVLSECGANSGNLHDLELLVELLAHREGISVDDMTLLCARELTTSAGSQESDQTLRLDRIDVEENIGWCIRIGRFLEMSGFPSYRIPLAITRRGIASLPPKRDNRTVVPLPGEFEYRERFGYGGFKASDANRIEYAVFRAGDHWKIRLADTIGFLQAEKRVPNPEHIYSEMADFAVETGLAQRVEGDDGIVRIDGAVLDRHDREWGILHGEAIADCVARNAVRAEDERNRKWARS